MVQWQLKTSSRQLLLLICCLAIALPGMAGPALCPDCACCDPGLADVSVQDAEASCCCCDAPVPDEPSCCEAGTTVAMQSSCHCQGSVPATQPCLLMDKTENLNSPLAYCHLTVSQIDDSQSTRARRYNACTTPPGDPELLRSVILLI